MRLADPVVGKGVCERGFVVDGESGDVPGVLWTPEDTLVRALVLMGHGYTLDKRAPYLVALGRRLARRHVFAAASIDAAARGDRPRPIGDADAVALTLGEAGIDRMVADWRCVLDELRSTPGIGPVPVGYWGLSLGTILGLPFVAAEPRIRVAVLGLAPLGGAWLDRHTADAPRVAVPVLFLQQWDDELFRRRDVLNLFDAIGTADKRLHVNPGSHALVPPDEFDATERFLVERLSSGA